MEFIRTIREKQQTARQESIAKEAEEIYTLGSFANTLYIAYKGIPLLEMPSEATVKEVMQQLSVMRNAYINSKSEFSRTITCCDYPYKDNDNK